MNIDKFGRFISSNKHYHSHLNQQRNLIYSTLLSKLIVTSDGDINASKCRIRDITADELSLESDVSSIKYVHNVKTEILQNIKTLIMEINNKLDSLEKKITDLEEKYTILDVEIKYIGKLKRMEDSNQLSLLNVEVGSDSSNIQTM